jgi:hypothetical protein
MVVVKVRSVAWRDEAWEIRFEIREGVYRLDDYPVRITHLGRSDAPGFADDVAIVATGLLRMHMRRGAVPPHAVVINWGRVVRLSQGGPAEVAEAIARISHKTGEEVESTVSQQF